MLKKLTLSVVLLALVLIGTVAVSAQDDGFIRYPITIDPSHLNMFTSDEIANEVVLNTIYEGLVRFNPVTGGVEPGLAESWDVATNDAGQQVYTFHLRHGVLFHDIPAVDLEDREVTADDVLWNYMVKLNPDPEVAGGSNNLRFIQGASEYMDALQAKLDAGEEVPLIDDTMTVAGLKAVDDYTVEITLSQPDRLFLINGGVRVTSPEAYSELGEAFSNTPVGTGPYRFVEWLRQDRVVVEANPDYYIEGVPTNAGVRFINYGDANTALLDYREGNLDFLFSFPAGQRTAIINEFGDEFNEIPGLHVRYWGFNMVDGQLADKPLVRQAMSHALDRATAWDVFAEGARFPADRGMLPPAMPASTPATIYDYNLERAAELLTEAGYPNGEGLPTIKIYLLQAIAEEAQVVVWQEALESLGLSIEFIVEDGSTYFDSIITDKADVFQNGWAAAIPDPSDVFDYLILNGEGSMRWENEDVDALLLSARVEVDPAVRETTYQQVHDMVMAEAIVIPSAYNKVAWLQKPYVEGFEPGGNGTHSARLYTVVLSR